MLLGILGGTFDPVHYGHLLLAESCREQLQLQQVWLLPAELPPHKRQVQPTASHHRLEMLRLAVAGHPSLHVSTLEADRGGLSYTIETLQTIARLHPKAELFFLMGADSLVDLPTWREPERICRLAWPVVVRRQGAPEPDLAHLAPLVSAERLAGIRARQVTTPVIELSSSELRRRVAAGLSIRFRTPRAVEQYIQTHQLYQPASDANSSLARGKDPL